MASSCKRCVLGFLVVLLLSLASVECDGDGDGECLVVQSWAFLELV